MAVSFGVSFQLYFGVDLHEGFSRSVRLPGLWFGSYHGFQLKLDFSEKGVSIETRTVHTFQNVSSPRLSEDAFEFKLPSDAVEQGVLSVPAELSKLLDSGALGTAETEIPEASK